MEEPDRPGRLDLHANRNVPYLKTAVTFRGPDFTGATFRVQVRLLPQSSGAPLIDLSSASVSGDRLLIAASVIDGLIVTDVRFFIDRASIDAILPWPANGLEPDTPVKLYWDMTISGPTVNLSRWLEGNFFIHEGVTR
jgi:hypothetical protein